MVHSKNQRSGPTELSAYPDASSPSSNTFLETSLLFLSLGELIADAKASEKTCLTGPLEIVTSIEACD